jgi:hypothetical protein
MLYRTQGRRAISYNTTEAQRFVHTYIHTYNYTIAPEGLIRESFILLFTVCCFSRFYFDRNVPRIGGGWNIPYAGSFFANTYRASADLPEQ